MVIQTATPKPTQPTQPTGVTSFIPHNSSFIIIFSANSTSSLLWRAINTNELACKLRVRFDGKIDTLSLSYKIRIEGTYNYSGMGGIVLMETNEVFTVNR